MAKLKEYDRIRQGKSIEEAIEKGVLTHSLYPHQLEVLGRTYYNNKVAYYLDMGL